MQEFLDQNARKFGFCYGLQNVAEVAARLDAGGDALAAQVLTAAEHAVWTRLPLEKRKVEWLSGRMAAKKAFARYVAALNPGRACSEITVLNGQNRAPFIVGYPGLTLSISHSSEYAVAVVAPFSIGVDVEKIQARPLALADYFFCRDERVFVARECRSPAQKDATITRFWSRKEAVSKFLRLGGGLDFKRINTVYDDVCVKEVSGERIRLVSEYCAGYCISLALKAESVVLQ